MQRSVLPPLLLLCALGPQTGCGDPDGVEVGFVLVRADAVDTSGPLRATGLDRDHVTAAWCQVLGPTGVELAGERVDVDPDVPAGEQTLRLRSVPAGPGAFARIRGLDAEGQVYECGATGPFELRRGEKAFVTLVIDLPDPDDPDCEALCRGHADCEAVAYCPSPCVRNPTAAECTEALCRRDFIGQACGVGGCGPGFTCLSEAAGWPGGYCSAACVTDLNCPGRSVCWSLAAQKRCVRECTSDDDCRLVDGYSCREAGGGVRGCLPPE